MKVTMIAAASADGFIARNPGHVSTSWTSPEDKKFFVEVTKNIGLMIMGARTFATFNRALPGRIIYVYTHSPDDYGDMEGVIGTDKDPVTLLRELELAGHKEVALCGGSVVWGMYLQAGLIDEIFLCIEPVLFGAGIPLFDREQEAELTLIASRPLNTNTILQHYKVN